MDSGLLNLEIARGLDFGPVKLRCKDANGDPVPLAGWSAYAEARRKPDAEVIIDFAPVIEADDADGLITIPQIPAADTVVIPAGTYKWDLVLETPEGRRVIPPLLAGDCAIPSPITLPK